MKIRELFSALQLLRIFPSISKTRPISHQGGQIYVDTLWASMFLSRMFRDDALALEFPDEKDLRIP
jgi:hypothetical protein